MKTEIKFTVTFLAEHKNRSLKALTKIAKSHLPKKHYGTSFGAWTRAGYCRVVVKSVSLLKD